MLLLALILGVSAGFAFPMRVEDPANPDAILTFNHPIWVDGSVPSGPKVALFRRTFRLPVAAQKTELQIFADTRYELWIDGRWAGRGPARFSETLREYDVYPLGLLSSGDHLIAVLVQWAPNYRRSESTAPMLMVNLQETGGLKRTTILSSSSDWKAISSDAWQPDAELVHDGGLIGPTELLDFRRLPANWQQANFNDQGWPNAVVAQVALPERPDAAVKYQPRSIAPLADFPMPAVLLDAGRISPGCSFGEIVPPVADPYRIDVESSQPGDLRVEILSITDPPEIIVKIDGRRLDWQAAGEKRLDVFQVSTKVAPGPHQIEFTRIPADGATYCVTNTGGRFTNVNLEQGLQAGRRTSLADLVSEPDQVRISKAPDGWRLEFDRLPAYAILDLGRTVIGRVEAEVNGPPGSIVDVGWDERLRTPAGRPYPYLGSLYPSWDQVDSWVLDGSEREMTTIDVRAGRYLLIAVWGKGPVEISKLKVFEERYPLSQTGEFHSSDPLLDQIWQVGVDTLLPNMTDAFTDTPWRERGQWWGDAHAESLISQVAFRDHTLMRRGLIYMADAMKRDPAPGMVPNNQGKHMVDYAMYWVLDLADYVQMTGDRSFAIQLFPTLEGFMDHIEGLENRSSRLLDLPEGPWGWTSYIDVTGYQSRFDQSTALNTLYAQTLADAAQIATLVGNPGRAEQWNRKSARVKTVINRYFYSEASQSYFTRFKNDAFYPPTVEAQAWPLAYGIVPAERTKPVARALLDLLSKDPQNPNTGTFGMLWVLEGLGKAGDYQQAIDLIHLFYGYILNSGTHTWWEGFHAGESAGASISHGWSGGPTWFLTTYILGARQIGPDRWQVQPSFVGVENASGVLPLEKGELHVAWERLGCGEISLKISAPQTTQGEAIFPSGWQGLELTLDGQTIWKDGSPQIDGPRSSSQGILIPLQGGLHRLHGIFQCSPEG